MPNPFFFAGKITNPEHFVGREKELKKIFGYLDATHTGQIQHVSVVGERRIGKSSLLYHISQTYQNRFSGNEHYRFIYLDLQNPHCHTMPGLLNHILERLGLPAQEKLTLAKFYDLMEQQHEKRNIWAVLLMDEFEYLTERNTDFPDEFYNTFRSLGGNNIFGIVTASQHPLQTLKQESKLTSNFFNIFHKVDLKEFSDVEAHALLNRGRVSDYPLTDEDCSRILKIAGKYPARLQIVASLVYETKSSQQAVNWKNIRLEALNEPPFMEHRHNEYKTTNWILTFLLWLFWHVPQYVGHTALVVIGRGDQTNDATDRMIGYITIAIPIALWLGIISWPLVTKMIHRLSELFFQ